MSDNPIIKRVATRAVKAGLGRPTCFYCHDPLYVKGGRCTNCGAPATPRDDPPTPEEFRKVKDEIKRKPRRDTPAMFFK